MFVKTVCIHHSNKTVTDHYANKLENHQNKIKKKYHLFSIFTNHKILLKKMYFIVLSSTKQYNAHFFPHFVTAKSL